MTPALFKQLRAKRARLLPLSAKAIIAFAVLYTSRSWSVKTRKYTPISQNTVHQWRQFLPSTNTDPDYCTDQDEAALSWINQVYTQTFDGLKETCAQTHRIGPEDDGGKIFCEDNFSSDECVVYSLGSNLDFSFELAFKEAFNCTIFTFDCTVDIVETGAVPDVVSFFPWCVGGRNEQKAISSNFGRTGEIGQYYTLEHIKKTLGHKKIDLLKMDIERHELAVWESITSQSAPKQVLFETHLHNAYGMWKQPVCSKEWIRLWHHIRSLGYRIFSYEPNPLCLCCSEWSIQL